MNKKRSGENESVDVLGLGQSGNERPARLVLPVQSRCEGPGDTAQGSLPHLPSCHASARTRAHVA